MVILVYSFSKNIGLGDFFHSQLILADFSHITHEIVEIPSRKHLKILIY